MTNEELELALKTERLANKLLLDKVAELEAKLNGELLKLKQGWAMPVQQPQYPYWQPIQLQPNHLYRDNSGNMEQWHTHITCQQPPFNS